MELPKKNNVTPIRQDSIIKKSERGTELTTTDQATVEWESAPQGDEIERNKFDFEVTKPYTRVTDTSFADDNYLQKMKKFVENMTAKEDDTTMANNENEDKYINEKFKNIDQKIAHQEEKTDLKFDQLIQKIDGHSQKMDDHLEHSRQMTNMMSDRLNSVSNRMDNIDQRLDNLRYWIVGTGIGIIVIVISVVAILSSSFQSSLDRSITTSDKKIQQFIESSNQRTNQFIQEVRRSNDVQIEEIKDLQKTLRNQKTVAPKGQAPE